MTVNISQLAMLVMRVHLALMRFGLIQTLAGVLCITGLAAWLWGIPYLHEQQSIQRLNWLRTQQGNQADAASLPIERHTTAEENFYHFMGVLGDPLGTEKQIKTLFALAQITGLTLSQAEYKLADDKNGHYRTYQIVLPVKGSYSAIIRFCEKALLAIPFASLDEMSFKRETIGSDMLEARLRFMLYLSESSPAALKDRRNINSRKDAS